MINLNKKALYVAVAASLGAFAAGNANAVSTFASELPVGSSFAAGTWKTGITSYSPTTANPLYLTFRLTNGASYTALAATDLVCSAGLGSAVQTAGHIALAAGGAGTAIATFVVTGVSAGAMLTSCTITNNSVLAASTITFGETVSAVYGNALATPTVDSTGLTSAMSMFTNAATAMTNTAMVQTGFITFNSAASGAVSTSTAQIGAFTLALNGALLSTGSAANLQNISAMATAITVSLAGNVLAAARATAGLYITEAIGSAAQCTAGATVVISANGGAANITFTAFAAPATATVNYGVCMGTTGTVIPEGTITVGVVGTPNTDPVNANGSAYQISTLIAAGTTVGTITHNGASTTVLNLPRSVDTDSGFLRVYNTSTLAGPVSVTIYDQAGTALVTNCTLTSSLAGNGALVLPVSTIVSTCAFTEPATGRYRMDLVGAFPTMRAQGMVRSGGVLTNVSADTSSNNN